jgi:hypothetical protein
MEHFNTENQSVWTQRYAELKCPYKMLRDFAVKPSPPGNEDAINSKYKILRRPQDDMYLYVVMKSEQPILEVKHPVM